MEDHGKISGRQKQLLKTGVQVSAFAQTMASSPWFSEWQQTLTHDGHTFVHVQDWQIDLGNYCNSACLFCSPQSSSRIAAERMRLGMIKQMPPPAWCDEPELVDRFIQDLIQAPTLRYLHFIGGETLITPAFKIILQRLIDHDLNKDLVIGFTTNLTVMDDHAVKLLEQFEQVNLGMSIECLDRVNDYVRYGSTIEKTLDIMNRWITLGRQRGWLIQLRITPTLLTINRLSAVYEYAWNNHLVVESCNFIHDPVFMRPSVLPAIYRQRARDQLQSWIDSKIAQGWQVPQELVLNIRNPNKVHDQLLQDAQSYIQYLDSESDLAHLLPDFISFIKLMDQSRGNSVTAYLPEYEELFRSAGY